MLLFGAGGHAKVVSDCLHDNDIQIEGIFDDNPAITNFQDINFLGKYSSYLYQGSKLIISIGDNLKRCIISVIVQHPFGNCIHPSAIISKSAELGTGSVVFHGAIIQSSSTIGRHAIVNTSASIDHDCKIGDFVHISPKAVLCGSVSVDTGAHIGASSVIIPGINIGKWTTIGAGAVVINNIPDYAVAVGNPAKIIKYNNRLENINSNI